MLVDNSIVVMENVYRFSNEGMPAPKAAVRGTAQVAGPILASTLTTICVFLPMVYTSGMVSQLLIPFAFTISYALIASLLVALTVVPTMGSVILRKAKEIKQPWFEKIKDIYGNILELALRFKIIPLLISIVLLIICVMQSMRTGIVMMDDMDSNQEQQIIIQHLLLILLQKKILKQPRNSVKSEKISRIRQRMYDVKNLRYLPLQ